MKCIKCGAEMPDGMLFCGSCGAGVAAGGAGQRQDQLAQWWSATAAMLARDPVVFITGIGSILLCVGSFLSWITGPGPDGLGLQQPAGPAVLVLGAIIALAMMLARGGAPGAWGIVIVVLSAVSLALIFQEMMYLDDNLDSGLLYYAHGGQAEMGAGVYVAMVGGLLTAVAGLMEATRAIKK